MNGSDLYNHICDFLANGGVRTDTWSDLDDRDRAAWDDLADWVNRLHNEEKQ